MEVQKRVAVGKAWDCRWRTPEVVVNVEVSGKGVGRGGEVVVCEDVLGWEWDGKVHRNVGMSNGSWHLVCVRPETSG